MKRWFAIVLVVVSFASVAASQKNQSSAGSSPSYLVGILPFSDASGNTDIGSLAQILPKMLQATLLEHSSLVPQQLDPSLARSNSDSSSDANSSDSGQVSDPVSAAALGKTKHADLVLIGQILSGNVETKDGSFNGPSFRGLTMSGKSRSQKSVVMLQVDVIDVGRGQRIATFRATGGDTENKIDPSVNSGYGSMDMTSTGFKNSSLGKATQQALNDIVGKVIDAAKKFTPAPASPDDSSAGSASDKPAEAKTASDSDASTDAAADAKPPTSPASLDGLVADVNGTTLILNVGKNNGVQVGDKLKVGRTSREIKDPATGKVIRRIDTALGEVTITQVDDLSAEGTYSGAPGVKVGDHVKR